jgi:hypothetical protein
LVRWRDNDAAHLHPLTDMPSADRYARYRADQTTIWVSKTAAAALARERVTPSESAGAVLDRLLTELRRLRRAQGAAKTPAISPTISKRAATRQRGRTRGSR